VVEFFCGFVFCNNLVPPVNDYLGSHSKKQSLQSHTYSAVLKKFKKLEINVADEK
jgi:hypothetical protein